MNENKRFVKKPYFNNLDERGLTSKDILTYTALRSFYNSKIKHCFPTYQTIGSRARLSKGFVSESIKRLEAASLIEIWRIGKRQVRHCYIFPAQPVYQKVPFELLTNSELTASEKAILLLLFEHIDITLKVKIGLKTISEISGVAYRTIRQHALSLHEKGYLTKINEVMPDTLESRIWIKLSDKINWNLGQSEVITLKAKTEDEAPNVIELTDILTGVIRLSSTRQLKKKQN